MNNLNKFNLVAFYWGKSITFLDKFFQLWKYYNDTHEKLYFTTQLSILTDEYYHIFATDNSDLLKKIYGSIYDISFVRTLFIAYYYLDKQHNLSYVADTLIKDNFIDDIEKEFKMICSHCLSKLHYINLLQLLVKNAEMLLRGINIFIDNGRFNITAIERKKFKFLSLSLSIFSSAISDI